MDGTIFDSSRDRGKTFPFILGTGRVIKGWDIAVATMKAGELAEVTIAPDYAYGSAGSPPKIPPDATLIFEIELFQWGVEDITKHQDGGVTKKIIKEGEGYTNPLEQAKVEVSLEGSYKGRVFDKRQVSFILGDGFDHQIIDGIEIALARMKKDEKSIVDISRDYAWGSTAPPSEYGLPSDYEKVTYTVHLHAFEKLKEPWEMTDEEKVEAAEAAKEKGTKYFKANNIEQALKHYNRILKLIGKY